MYHVFMVSEFNQVDLVIGGDGFIGQKLVSQLIAKDRQVLVVDKGIHRPSATNSSDSKKFFTAINGDINDADVLRDLESRLKPGSVYIWHLAANSDISKGSENLDIDFSETLMTSKAVAILASKIKTVGIFFASSSAVYGEYGNHRVSEIDVCKPISYYGMAKLASEHLLAIASENNGHPLTVLRFANIVGGGMTHGILYDFYRKLRISTDSLEVLGNGTQRKTYLHVNALVETMIKLNERNVAGIFNIGPSDEGVSVSEIVAAFIDHVSPKTQPSFSNEDRGWRGDVPIAVMDSSKLVEQIGKSFQFQKSEDVIHLAIHQEASILGIQTNCDFKI